VEEEQPPAEQVPNQITAEGVLCFERRQWIFLILQGIFQDIWLLREVPRYFANAKPQFTAASVDQFFFWVEPSERQRAVTSMFRRLKPCLLKKPGPITQMLAGLLVAAIQQPPKPIINLDLTSTSAAFPHLPSPTNTDTQIHPPPPRG
jgi:hypothetical protein